MVSIAQNCSETQIAFSTDQPSRKKRGVDRPKLKRNANFICSRSTLSVKTWCRSLKTVVKPHIFVCAKRVGSRWIDSYIFVHGAVAKRALSHLGMHGVVVRSTFCFWRMNPLAGSGVSIARNCSETQIFGENCRKHRTKRSFWKHCSMKFGGSLARNDHFGSFLCENCRKHRTKRSFCQLVL